MTEVYAEPGSSYWPVLWGPVFALLGLAVEALSGPVHPLGWSLAGLGLAAAAAMWVRARRSVCSVSLTAESLRQGKEELPVARIAEVLDGEESLGARVLGGGWLAPKGTTGVPLRLEDESVVLAWARDAGALREALTGLISQ
ncbi:hypothetical protein [Kutzneria albida]|uniref:Uncharacterized protein n=1 Tax=Kutzneria albida DSM 43870 TaxID=1449976 RepID=W5WU84_9PSEU|nr:hypothetical protein [Kutzneria albida]AHI01700.1 hypothetical protein KALB_8343 [Kutzneria albida DSM 43870]